ncbi:hypothetical protein [Idiomarina abyssalis]|uniref:Uncharacterized protein n=1 Tax=Idiomarina abyssalis TaxID=86102 RepID=A0A8I1KIF2_9GAMM|nr:hypothetical protein [Idiomarina abyssalis]MBJ7265481.1 hypothetical protein [Idiomarina abyssalis]MBJ7316845.1 hypothetical protein [Idiomarina abyssalis]
MAEEKTTQNETFEATVHEQAAEVPSSDFSIDIEYDQAEPSDGTAATEEQLNNREDAEVSEIYGSTRHELYSSVKPDLDKLVKKYKDELPVKENFSKRDEMRRIQADYRANKYGKLTEGLKNELDDPENLDGADKDKNAQVGNQYNIALLPSFGPLFKGISGAATKRWKRPLTQELINNNLYIRRQTAELESMTRLVDITTDKVKDHAQDKGYQLEELFDSLKNRKPHKDMSRFMSDSKMQTLISEQVTAQAGLTQKLDPHISQQINNIADKGILDKGAKAHYDKVRESSIKTIADAGKTVSDKPKLDGWLTKISNGFKSMFGKGKSANMSMG